MSGDSHRAGTGLLARRAGAFLVPFAALVAWMAWVIVPERSDAFVVMLAEMALLSSFFGLAAVRHPQGEVRVSDPLVVLGLVFFYYYMFPAIKWSSGLRFGLEHDSSIRLVSPIVVWVQWMHIAFMGGVLAAYLASAPLKHIAPIPLDAYNRLLPRGRPVAILGILPFLLTILDRIVREGSILPQRNYGAAWGETIEATTEANRLGGADQFIVQLLSKVYFIPSILFGIGLGLVLAQRLREGRKVAALMLLGIAPVLMFLSGGSRGFVAMPFLMAVVVADMLAGPIKKRYLLALALVGMAFFNAFSIYRGVQDQGFSAALESTTTELQTRNEQQFEATEDSSMLVKEAYALAYTDATGEMVREDYFLRSVLSLLPVQVLPDKANWETTAGFLSRALLGTRGVEAGGGVAGATMADGYMYAGVVGVILLAVVLGLILGLTERYLLAPRIDGGASFLHVALFLTWTCQLFSFARSELASVLIQLIYYLVLPLGAAKLLLRGPLAAQWYARLPWLARARKT